MLEKLLGRPLIGRASDNAILPIWWHSQNLDERPGDLGRASGSKAMAGRAWFHIGDGTKRWAGKPLTLRTEWNFRSTFCHVKFEVDDSERDITFGIGLPPVSLWFAIEGLPDWVFKTFGVSYEQVKDLPDGCYLMQREISLSIHDWALWWSLWHPLHTWSSSTPRWRHGSFHFIDALFGDGKYEKREVEKQAVLIPMPERNYRGEVSVEQYTVKRPRWPFPFGPDILYRSGLSYTITMEKGEQIPFPGKGENSWDCGDDALFSQSGTGGVTEAISGVVQSVFRSRRRNGGTIAWKPEPPATAVEA